MESTYGRGAGAAQPSETKRSLAELIDAERDELSRRWIERVRVRYAPRSLSRPEILDSLPDFLEAIVQTLRASEAQPRSTRAPSSIAAIGSAHGTQRYSKGFDLEAIVREYGELREVIFDLIEEAGLTLSVSEIRVLTRCLSTATAEAVSCYAEQRAEEQRGNERRVQTSEALLKTVIETFPVGVWVADADGKIVVSNPAGRRIWGGVICEDVETYARQAIFRAETGEPLPPDECAFMKAWKRGETSSSEVVRIRTIDGQDKTIANSAAPLWDAEGRISGAVAVNEDITERARLEEEARRRSWFEQQLIGIVSHDLRNPVGAILFSASALLRRDDLDERTLKAVVRIQRSTERVTRMISDLLDLTQARLGGGIPITRAEADLLGAVRQVVEEVKAVDPERTIDLVCDGDLAGAWDTDRVAQVLTNLLRNAVAYSPPKSLVTVRAAGEPDAVVLRVHNTGEPIAAELLPHLFEPMKRGAGVAPNVGRSLGLGLFIVKHIVEAHGGTIEVRSREGDGTEFTVRLPRRAAACSSEPPRSPETASDRASA